MKLLVKKSTLCYGNENRNRNLLNGQHSKLITDIPDVDIAISMGCNVGCPFIGRAFDDNWGLDDPTGKSDDDFKAVIQRIEENIMELIGICGTGNLDYMRRGE